METRIAGLKENLKSYLGGFVNIEGINSSQAS